MFLLGLAVGVAVATLGATGLAAMAVWVAATEEGRFEHENCVEHDGYP